MNVRFYFTAKALADHGMKPVGIGSNDKRPRYGIYHESVAAFIAQAELDGCHFQFTDVRLSHPDLQKGVSHMTVITYPQAKLTEGEYSGAGWEATIIPHGNERSVIYLQVEGGDVDQLKKINEQLIKGEFLPSLVVGDKKLTSEQVANVVLGNGDREHWLSVVQGAQDAMTRTFEHIQAIQAQLADLKAKNAELEALIAGQGK